MRKFVFGRLVFWLSVLVGLTVATAVSLAESASSEIPGASEPPGGISLSELADLCRTVKNPGEGCRAVIASDEGGVDAITVKQVPPKSSKTDGPTILQTFTCTGSPCDGTPNDDNITAWIGHSTEINGLAGDDSIHGNEFVDVMHGNTGKDVLTGADAGDWLIGDGSADEIYGGDGWDRVLENGTYVRGLEGDDGWDLIRGGPGNDVLLGGNGQDDMKAQDGDDILIGTGDGGDPDALDGGAGNDQCFPGANDTETDC